MIVNNIFKTLNEAATVISDKIREHFEIRIMKSDFIKQLLKLLIAKSVFKHPFYFPCLFSFDLCEID